MTLGDIITILEKKSTTLQKEVAFKHCKTLQDLCFVVSISQKSNIWHPKNTTTTGNELLRLLNLTENESFRREINKTAKKIRVRDIRNYARFGIKSESSFFLNEQDRMNESFFSCKDSDLVDKVNKGIQAYFRTMRGCISTEGNNREKDGILSQKDEEEIQLVTSKYNLSKQDVMNLKDLYKYKNRFTNLLLSNFHLNDHVEYRRQSWLLFMEIEDSQISNRLSQIYLNNPSYPNTNNLSTSGADNFNPMSLFFQYHIVKQQASCPPSHHLGFVAI